MFSINHSIIFFKAFDFVCTIRIHLTSRKMAKILLNFPLCVSAKREKCSIRHGAKIYRWYYWGIYQAIQQDRVFEMYHNINQLFFYATLNNLTHKKLQERSIAGIVGGYIKSSNQLEFLKYIKNCFSMQRCLRFSNPDGKSVMWWE